MIFKSLFILFFFSFYLYADINKDIHNAFSIYKASERQKKVLKSIVYRAMNEFERENNIKFYTTFPKNEKQEIEEFAKYENINVLATYISIYLKNKDFFKSTSQEIYSLGIKEKFTQYYLIANKSSGIKDIKDLKNKQYLEIDGNDAYTIWLDYLTLKNLGKSYDKVIKNKKISYKDSTVLLDLFFKKSDFAVLPKNIYEDMLMLNPSLKRELLIIEKSEPIFMFAIILIHKKTPKNLVQTIRKTNNELKHLLHFVGRDNIRKIELEDLEALESFYDEYQKLKKSFQ